MGVLKSAVKQLLIRRRLHGRVTLGGGVRLSKDFRCGQGVSVLDHVTIDRNVELGDRVRIGRHAYLANLTVGRGSFLESFVLCTGDGSGHITIGEETYIGLYGCLDWSNDLTIGSYVHVAGPTTGIWTHTSVHMALYGDPLAERSRRTTAPVVIEDFVYIGGNCTIYPGVTIGHHCVVLPNSAVSTDLEPYTMVGGVPVKVIKTLDPKDFRNAPTTPPPR